METKIFREKSVDRVASPEQLDEYVKVATPGVWMILVSVILLLAGVCVWGIFGRISTTVTVGADCKSGILTCYISESDIENVTEGLTVTVNGQDYEITTISDTPQELSSEINSRILHIGNLVAGTWVYKAEVNTQLQDGIYEAVITTESISPMSFILN